MIDSKEFLEELGQKDLTFFAGVPDSLLKDICGYIDEVLPKENHIITANEGSAISLGIGYFLATEKIPIIYMQNSGMGNTVNPLVSLADKEVYSIPMILLIGWRGEPGKKDEPQHVKQGRVTPGLLDVLEIPYEVLPDNIEEAGAVITKLKNRTLSEGNPVALLVKKGTFASYKASKNSQNEELLTREQAIQAVGGVLGENDVVVSTTGKTSRELFEFRMNEKTESHPDFLTIGGMGHASQVALGIALNKKDRQIFCMDGDGAAIMHLGGMALIGELAPSNYIHIILNNGVHDSVGGQAVAGGQKLDFQKIAMGCGYEKYYKAVSEKEVREFMTNAKNSQSLTLLEIIIKPGARADLTRPNITPKDNKKRFIDMLKS